MIELWVQFRLIDYQRSKARIKPNVNILGFGKLEEHTSVIKTTVLIFSHLFMVKIKHASILNRDFCLAWWNKVTPLISCNKFSWFSTFNMKSTSAALLLYYIFSRFTQTPWPYFGLRPSGRSLLLLLLLNCFCCIWLLLHIIVYLQILLVDSRRFPCLRPKWI